MRHQRPGSVTPPSEEAIVPTYRGGADQSPAVLNCLMQHSPTTGDSIWRCCHSHALLCSNSVGKDRQMTTFTDLRESMNAALEDLYREAQDVRDVLVLPNWGS